MFHCSMLFYSTIKSFKNKPVFCFSFKIAAELHVFQFLNLIIMINLNKLILETGDTKDNQENKHTCISLTATEYTAKLSMATLFIIRPTCIFNFTWA